MALPVAPLRRVHAQTANAAGQALPGATAPATGVQGPAVPPRIVRSRAAATQRPPPARPPAAPGDIIQSIRVEGNERIETGTILSYILLRPGDPFDADRMDRSLKTLYATGLFSDVTVRRDGPALVVHVAENPLVNRVAFEGNRKLDDNNLTPVVQLKPRSVYTPQLAQADRQRILADYAQHGRYAATVEPEIIRLGQNRVDVVFKIDEGPSTLISRIAFVGNHAFGEGTLRDVINSRQQAWWRIFTNADTYDADRVNFDKELLRRFYLRNGYADFEVLGATAELSPDRKAFFLTFTLHEGDRYRVGKVTVTSHLRNISAKKMERYVEQSAGDWYDGDAVQRSVDAISDAVRADGQPFVDVKPTITREPGKHVVDLTFDITEGPRVYVERIDIVGNTRTQDKVIRREFRLAEGDAYNPELVRRTRQRLDDLGYFNTVNIETQPGSSPDRANLLTTVDEKATGQFTIGGGYSTDVGALANIGLSERNLVGTGIDAGINAVVAQRETQIDFSLNDPYFLDRNLVAGIDIFDINTNVQDTAQYSEKRLGFTTTLGYQFNDHVSQAWNYTLVSREVYDIATTASLYVKDQQGYSTLSQIGQTFTIDYRDSRIDPHTGWVIRLGADFAGLGGTADFIRLRADARYYIPLDRFTGNSDWGIALSAGTGYLIPYDHPEEIIDNFFLGGDNLRGFESGGVGPHDITTGDSLGGRFLWTQSTELRFPLPVPPDIGLSGRTFVDLGSLYGVKAQFGPVIDSSAVRMGVGVGVSWKTPFGLINIDVADAVLKQNYDQTQVFRLGFGTRF